MMGLTADDPPHDAVAAVFPGDGEMAARCRALDWAATPLGPVDAWPAALRVAAQMVLAAGLPNIVLWGPELVQLYNDAYAALIRAKHPHALGRGNRETWPEVWHLNAPIYARVFAGETVTVEDAYYPLLRQGREGAWAEEDAYLTISFSPIRDARGAVAGVLANMLETTREVERRQLAEERARLLAELDVERTRLAAVFQQSPSFLAVLRGPDNVFERVNAAYEQLVGRGRALLGRPLLEALPEARGQGFDALLARVRATGESLVFRDLPVQLDRTPGAPREERFMNITYQPLVEVDGAGGVSHDAVIAHGVDVTEEVLARRALERSQGELQGVNAELAQANAQLQERQLEFELANQQLQDQAAELEAQTEELQTATAALERRTAEAEAARAQVEAVLGSIADAFYLLDRDWRFTYVNGAAEPLLQTTAAALLGRTLWEAFPGVVGSVFEGPYREAMATGRATSVEAYFDPLGTWFDVRSYPWVGGLMVHFRDVGARRAAEAERERLIQQLGVERARLEEVFRRSPSFAVVYRGADYVYEFVNEAYYQLVGHRPLIGRPLDEAIPEAREQGFPALLDRVVATGEPWVGRETPVWLERTAGAPRELRYVDMIFQPLVEADGTRSGVIAHGTDVTDQVLARREVERLLAESQRARADAESARAEAEAANRAKSQFLTTMSHELRTPLNAIGGYAELLALGVRGPVTEAQRDDLERLRRANQHMAGLVTDVLNFARIEAGQVEYHLEPVRLGPLVHDLEALVAPQLAARGLTYDHDGCGPDTPELPHVVRADPEKVRQILLNLLTNAIKFTDHGGRVTLACEADPAAGAIRVRVTDTGRGIAPDQLTRVFEPFVQLDRQRTQASQQGVGLGLAISRDLARGMGGELTAVSTPGVGSTFTLTLPAA